MSAVSSQTVSPIPSAKKQTAKVKGQLTNCKQCNGNLKMWKDKGETEPKLTCQDCGWRIGDKVKRQTTKPQTVATDRRAAESAKDNATKVKNKLRKANAVEIKAKAKPAPQTDTTRNYGLDFDRAAELKKAKAFNAYREGSSYWCVVEALHELGIGKLHSAADLLAAYGKVCDRDSMKAFKAKESRNDATGLGWKERILQNAYVTTRQDYGKRMRDIGWEVRCEREDDGQTFGLFRLNGKGK